MPPLRLGPDLAHDIVDDVVHAHVRGRPTTARDAEDVLVEEAPRALIEE